MNRAARLKSAKHWLLTYEGRDVVKGNRKWYGVSTACAIIELRQLGVKIDEQRLIQAKRPEESTARQHAKKKQERTEKLAAEEVRLVESDDPANGPNPERNSHRASTPASSKRSARQERCCFLCGSVNSTDPLRILTCLSYKKDLPNNSGKFLASFPRSQSRKTIWYFLLTPQCRRHIHPLARRETIQRRQRDLY